jgi:drug/metabolite transporter (DMT)-like permease
MKTQDWGLLLLLAAIWGASYIFIGVSAPVVGPFWVVLIRTTLGCAVLLAYARWIGQSIPWRQYWRNYLILGALNNAIPFALISGAELDLSSALASILNATSPLFTALIMAALYGDRLTLPRVAGLVLGIFGVVLVVGWDQSQVTSAFMLAAGMTLLAAFFYALAAVYGKARFKGAIPLTTAVGQLGSAALLILPFAAVNPPTQPLNSSVILALLALGIMCSALAYLIYFRLLASAGATNATTVTFLMPFFSILWAWLFLGETIGVPQFVGLLVILSGLLLVTGLRPANLRRPQPAL